VIPTAEFGGDCITDNAILSNAISRNGHSNKNGNGNKKSKTDAEY